MATATKPQDAARDQDFDESLWSYDPATTKTGLLFAVPGAGKTHFWAEALARGDFETARVFEFDKGLKTAERLGVMDRVEFKFYRDRDWHNPKAYTEFFNDIADLLDGEDVHGILRGAYLGEKIKSDYLRKPPHLNVIDGLTGLTRVVWSQVLLDRGVVKRRRSTVAQAEIDAGDLKDYELHSSRMAEVLDFITGLGGYLFVAAHEQPKNTSDEKYDPTKVPRARGSIRADIYQWFDEVWRLVVDRQKGGGIRRYAQTRPDQFVECRTRDSSLPDIINNPRLSHMLLGDKEGLK